VESATLFLFCLVKDPIPCWLVPGPCHGPGTKPNPSPTYHHLAHQPSSDGHRHERPRTNGSIAAGPLPRAPVHRWFPVLRPLYLPSLRPQAPPSDRESYRQRWRGISCSTPAPRSPRLGSAPGRPTPASSATPSTPPSRSARAPFFRFSPLSILYNKPFFILSILNI
jgi:hypothetical protein